MPSTDQIQAAVDRYLAAVANGTAGDIAACYAEDATLEDPAQRWAPTGHDGRSANGS
jgi:steroid delta-isomerase